MQLTNYHTYTEIKSQTNAWVQALEVTSASRLLKAGDYSQVIFTGCGSTIISRLQRQQCIKS